VEEIAELFSTAFAQVCALEVVDEVVVDGLTVGWRRLFCVFKMDANLVLFNHHILDIPHADRESP
jgi:hypothetical protein